MSRKAIKTTYGEALREQFTWRDGAGELISLDGAVVRVSEASNSALLNATFAPAGLGKAILRLLPEHARKMQLGPSNWIRVEIDFGNGENDVTPPIYIDVA